MTFLTSSFLAHGGDPEPSFQPYIFWAYSLACVLLFVFTAYSIAQTRKLADRVQYLDERLSKLAPDASASGAD